MEKIYKLGIVGFGGMAHYHRDQLDTYEKISVYGVYDIDPSKKDETISCGYVWYDTLDELLTDEKIDIVLVATTNEAHKEISVAALKAGKHVICEKPVTMSSDELLEIIAASQKYGKVFTIDQNRRTNKDFVLMRRSVEKGLVGKPYVIESRVEGCRGITNPWRSVKALGGGMMLDWGVHLIDQMMYMIDEKVIGVYCQMFSIHYPEVDDNFRLDITFESGLIAHIEVATNSYISHPRWCVFGTDGTLQIDNWDCEGRVVRGINSGIATSEEVFHAKAGPTKTMAPRSADTYETIELNPPLDVVDNLFPVYDQFCDAIEGKAKLTITAEQALRVMMVMEAAFESHENKKYVNTNI